MLSSEGLQGHLCLVGSSPSSYLLKEREAGQGPLYPSEFSRWTRAPSAWETPDQGSAYFPGYPSSARVWGDAAAGRG